MVLRAVAMARYIWRIGALAQLDRDQVIRYIAPTIQRYLTGRLRRNPVDVSLEQKWTTGTYVGLSGELLYSKTDAVQGGYIVNADLWPISDQYPPSYGSGFRKTLDYREASLLFSVDQLLGQQWSVGARYRLSQARLDSDYVDINPATLMSAVQWQPRQNLDSLLHTVNLHANWNHPSGLFSSLEGNWYHQDNSGYWPAEPGDDFWQFNACVGYRFWHRRAELTAGLLNIFDQNYRLEPLNLYNETARSRTFLARLKISF